MAKGARGNADNIEEDRGEEERRVAGLVGGPTGELSALLSKNPEKVVDPTTLEYTHTLALQATKILFDLSLHQEPTCLPLIQTLIARALQTEAEMDPEQSEGAATEIKYDPTPIDGLYTEMEHEQIWHQLDLKADKVCKALDEFIINEDPDMLAPQSGSEHDRADSEDGHGLTSSDGGEEEEDEEDDVSDDSSFDQSIADEASEEEEEEEEEGGISADEEDFEGSEGSVDVPVEQEASSDEEQSADDSEKEPTLASVNKGFFDISAFFHLAFSKDRN